MRDFTKLPIAKKVIELVVHYRKKRGRKLRDKYMYLQGYGSNTKETAGALAYQYAEQR